jgi:hypothetical protein
VLYEATVPSDGDDPRTVRALRLDCPDAVRATRDIHPARRIV